MNIYTEHLGIKDNAIYIDVALPNEGRLLHYAFNKNHKIIDKIEWKYSPEEIMNIWNDLIIKNVYQQI